MKLIKKKTEKFCVYHYTSNNFPGLFVCCVRLISIIFNFARAIWFLFSVSIHTANIRSACARVLISLLNSVSAHLGDEPG